MNLNLVPIIEGIKAKPKIRSFAPFHNLETKFINRGFFFFLTGVMLERLNATSYSVNGRRK